MEERKISVLMSIFNETEKDIKESVDSILRQTYTNIELIIIVDNPHRKEIIGFIEDYSDERVHLYINDSNIGLAESMNRALSLSTGDIIARMDADDIAVSDRFQKEIAILSSGNYDIVCANYYYIDENSKLIERPCTCYTNEQLVSYLPYSNTLHHPTVMMTRDAILRVNGYRNFPCSQDYDLWLRMQEAGCRFYILPEKLLYYRIRSNSITESKSFKQIATIRYIKRLRKERQNKGKDSYSIDNYNQYIDSLHLNDKDYVLKCEKYKKEKDKISLLRSSNTLKALTKMLMLFIKSDFYRRLYLENAKEIVSRKLALGNPAKAKAKFE